MHSMQEIAPGLYDWTTFHDGIGQPVHSHFHAPSGTLIDPRVPEGGVEAVAAVATPRRIALTNRHHLRHAQAFVEAYGLPVLVHETGLDDLADAEITVQGFLPGDVLAEGVRISAVGAITPEEVALHLDVGAGWLALADVVIGVDGGVGFVPDHLLGDDAETVKRDMVAALERLLAEETFEGLLLAHGDPLPDGRARLQAFVEAWTPTS